MANQPVKKFRIGYVSANVWKNDGVEKSFHTVDVQRTYKDDDGNLQNSSSFNHADLLNVIKVLERAEVYLSTL